MARFDRGDEDLRSLELRDLGEILVGTEYPVTTEELIATAGDLEVRYPHGSEPLRIILETSGLETYRSAGELELAILNGVRRDAVGRPRYSDRGDEVTEQLDRIPESF